MLLLYSIWLVPVFPRGWSTHLDSPDGRADRLINFFFFFFLMQRNTFVSLLPDLGCAIMVRAKGKAGDHRRSWAAHTGRRMRSNPSITGVTLERSNLEKEGKHRVEGDKQIEARSQLDTPPTPQGEAVAWMIPQIDVSEGSMNVHRHAEAMVKHLHPTQEETWSHTDYNFPMQPSFRRSLQKQHLHCGQNAAR